ncbi:MAG: 30S ribosomal protein S8 [Kiritimatiellae bacterium]|nr:30S ribosomal protein S8 [Kiritimatiellia bacterium]MBR1836647.1 30S ribosomal protein S8 [Kiritimatiellia bacterium]
MSWSDPIADMLVRIRNGQAAGREIVEMPSSNLKAAIAKVLKDEGYVEDFEVEGDVKKVLRIALKYNAEGKPVIRGLRRESSPGLRRFCGWKDIPRVLGGLGTAVVSTSGGVLSGIEARRRKLGGEIVCTVW